MQSNALAVSELVPIKMNYIKLAYKNRNFRQLNLIFHLKFGFFFLIHVCVWLLEAKAPEPKWGPGGPDLGHGMRYI